MMSYRSKRAKEIALCLLLAALLPEFARSQRVPPDPRPDEQLPPATQFSPSPDCPCLSQQDVYDKIMRSNVSSSLRPMPQVSCPDNGLPASVKDKGGVYRVLCLPPQLGSDVCRAWDSILFEVMKTASAVATLVCVVRR